MIEDQMESVYAVTLPEGLLTPALVIYPQFVDQNIQATIRLLGGDPSRWRPHLKTAKLSSTMRQLVARGVEQCKCATTLELKTACEAGFQDILLAHLPVKANASRLKDLAFEFSDRRMSVLVDAAEHVPSWKSTRIGAFVDICPEGMNRTGIAVNQQAAVESLIDEIRSAGLAFRGLHYYDGHLSAATAHERQKAAVAGYSQLMGLIDFLCSRGITIPEVITSGTITFLHAAEYAPFTSSRFLHRVSPGTVVYCDRRSLAQLPVDSGYQSAALIIASVVSHPGPGYLTCDAGHKSVSADAGVPTCEVIGYPDLVPLSPSEEHLPIILSGQALRPALGGFLYLRPAHICPTVNNFDHAWLVSDGLVTGVGPVSARGHEFSTDRAYG